MKKELYFELYKCFAVLKTQKKINKVDIINSIRGIEKVVTTEVEKKYESQFLQSPPEADYEKTLVKIKFLVEGGNDPKEELLKIKSDAIRIQGVQQFLSIERSIEKA